MNHLEYIISNYDEEITRMGNGEGFSSDYNLVFQGLSIEDLIYLKEKLNPDPSIWSWFIPYDKLEKIFPNCKKCIIHYKKLGYRQKQTWSIEIYDYKNLVTFYDDRENSDVIDLQYADIIKIFNDNDIEKDIKEYFLLKDII
jgi:hypothetical protein